MLRAIGQRYALLSRYIRSLLVRRLLGEHAVGILYDNANGRILLAPEDNFVGKWLGRRAGYGLGNLAILRRYLTPDSRVLFVGAHAGTLLIPVARLVDRVCGIEANPQTFDLLRLNLRLNGIENATLHHFAAGDEVRDVEFLVNTTNSGGSKIKPAADHFEFTYDRPRTAIVPMRPIDQMLGDEVFDVIVMDVEGSETMALRGMQRILAACRILQIEYVTNHLKKVADVTPEAFLATFAGQFDTAIDLEHPDGRVFRRDEFAGMLAAVDSGDFLFFSGDQPGAAVVSDRGLKERGRARALPDHAP